MRLCQIVANLVSNAVKFTDEGEVSVFAAIEAGSRSTLHFEVRDTGIGIPAGKQKIIFSAFTQGDASTTRKYGGTGLGLAISERLVRMMGGRIWVESEAGHGSRFHFTAHFDEAGDRGAAPSRPEGFSGIKVLVADDNATCRGMLTDVLRGWDMRPSLAASGAEAVEYARCHAAENRPFHLVVCDGELADMDGAMLPEKIRAASGVPELPIVLLTSTAARADAPRCRSLGIARRVTKPVRHSELRRTIADLLGWGPAEAPVVDPPARSEHEPLKILVAEDNPVNQRVARGLIEQLGHIVVVAQNGMEAVAAAEQQDFQVILMDVQMPGMDGLQATQEIRRRERLTGKHQAIIAMTAHAMTGDRERCLEAGMDGYLSKPVKRHELAESLAKLEEAVRKSDGGDSHPADCSPVERSLVR